MNSIKENSPAIMMSQLLSEIKDKKIERILRRVIFKGEDIRVVMKEERPETNLN
jgi:hypothetical protein